MRAALLFPGQGSQYVGMGRALWERSALARDLFARASDLLGYDAGRLCFEGPEERLNTTLYTQPSVYLLDVCVLRVLQQDAHLDVCCVAGHSLGEYAALVAAGSLTFEEGLRLVRERATLMQNAVPPGVGGMAAVIGLVREDVERICAACADHGVLVPANHNAPNQTVLSGEAGALERASEEARKAGARVVRLAVSAPFHSPLLASAAETFRSLLQEVRIQDPGAAWISNVTGGPVRSAESCRDLLARQICSPVLWEDSVRRMQSLGADVFVELGPGKVLGGLCRRIDRNIVSHRAESPDEIAAVARLLGEGQDAAE